MDRNELSKLNDLVNRLDKYRGILGKEYHYVTIETHDINHEGKITNTEKHNVEWELVRPIIERQEEGTIQELNKLGFWV